MGVVSKQLTLAEACARPPKDILPCCLPYPSASETAEADLSSVSRTVRSRVRRAVGWKHWANEGVSVLNELSSPGVPPPRTTSAAQRSALHLIESAYQSVGAPPSTTPAAAFSELCGARPGYAADVLKGRVNYRPGQTALPPTHSEFADGSKLLDVVCVLCLSVVVGSFAVFGFLL